jgi:hypothetical protein
MEKHQSFKVLKDNYGYHCKFSCSLGKGTALLMYDIKFPIKSGEIFLFGIETNPTNSGVGRIFLNKIFDEFNLSKIYLPSCESHPVWNKIATNTGLTIEFGGKVSTIFSLTKKQLSLNG